MSESEAELSAPGGWRAKLTGFDTPFLVIGLVIIACSAVLFWQNEIDRVQRTADAVRFLEQHKLTQHLLMTVTTNQAAIMAEVKSARMANSDDAGMIVYVLTLNQKDREALRLSMPPTLRKQINTRNQ